MPNRDEDSASVALSNHLRPNPPEPDAERITEAKCAIACYLSKSHLEPDAERSIAWSHLPSNSTGSHPNVRLVYKWARWQLWQEQLIRAELSADKTDVIIYSTPALWECWRNNFRDTPPPMQDGQSDGEVTHKATPKKEAGNLPPEIVEELLRKQKEDADTTIPPEKRAIIEIRKIAGHAASQHSFARHFSSERTSINALCEFVAGDWSRAGFYARQIVPSVKVLPPEPTIASLVDYRNAMLTLESWARSVVEEVKARESNNTNKPADAGREDQQGERVPSIQGRLVPYCDGKLLCSPDFGTVQRGQDTFTFTGNPRAVIRHMIEAYNCKPRTFTSRELLEACESTSQFISNVFKGHPAWGKMVAPVTGNKGIYELRPE